MLEGNEGKDLAYEKKVEFFIEELKSLINQCKELNNRPVESNGYKVSFEPETKRYKIVFSNTEIVLAQENKEGFSIDPESIDLYNQLAEQAENQGIATLERPVGLVESENLRKYLEKEQEKQGKKEQEENEQVSEEEGEENEEEKDDEKPELETDEEKKSDVAKKYNVSSGQTIHIDLKNRKLTKNERLNDLVGLFNEYDDVYVVQGKDEFSYKMVGRKKGEKDYSEIETQENQVYGKNPNVKIKRIDGEQIEEITPLYANKINNDSMIAYTRDKYGKLAMLYCKREAGKEEYWGTIVPEADTKNVKQGDIEERELLDSRYNSKHDLSKKAEELEKAQDLEARGAPSKEPGIQVYELGNREAILKAYIEDLKSRDGIVDELTRPSGFYEYKAEKILSRLEQAYEAGTDLSYEEALEEVENEGQREQGGPMRGEGNHRRRE